MPWPGPLSCLDLDDLPGGSWRRAVLTCNGPGSRIAAIRRFEHGGTGDRRYSSKSVVNEETDMAARRDSVVAFDVWGQRGWYSFDVAGESFHSKDIERLFPGKVPDEGATVEVEVQLVPEPTNRHDRNAVK